VVLGSCPPALGLPADHNAKLEEQQKQEIQQK
jgi:hypothetical protein